MSDEESDDSELRNLLEHDGEGNNGTFDGEDPSVAQPTVAEAIEPEEPNRPPLPFLPLLLDNEPRMLPRLRRRDDRRPIQDILRLAQQPLDPFLSDGRLPMIPRATHLDPQEQLDLVDLTPTTPNGSPLRPSDVCVLVPALGLSQPQSDEQDVPINAASTATPLPEEKIPSPVLAEQSTTIKSPSPPLDIPYATVIGPTVKYGYDTRRLLQLLCNASVVAFSAWLIVGAIVTEKARLAKDPNPLATTLISVFLLILLATMEGGQGSLIDLQVQQHQYSVTHPLAYRCTELAHRGDNMKRFIVGRQFLVFVVVFMANMFKVMNPPDASFVDSYFLSSSEFWSGTAVILTTIMFGQLNAQVNALHGTLDFVNSRMMIFVTKASLLVEDTGLLHAAYIFPLLYAKVTGNSAEVKESTRTPWQEFTFWTRACVSVALLLVAIGFTLLAMLQQKTIMSSYLPVPVALMLLAALAVFVGMFEALQIALFQLKNKPDKEFDNYPVAKECCDLACRGNNLKSILIGRQICVTTGVFVMAQLTTPYTSSNNGEAPGTFGEAVPNLVQSLFNTGLPAAFVVTILASLAWRVTAASFPREMLSYSWARFAIHFFLMLDSSGILSATGFVDLFNKTLFGKVEDANATKTMVSDERRFPLQQLDALA